MGRGRLGWVATGSTEKQIGDSSPPAADVVVNRLLVVFGYHRTQDALPQRGQSSRTDCPMHSRPG